MRQHSSPSSFEEWFYEAHRTGSSEAIEQLIRSAHKLVHVQQVAYFGAYIQKDPILSNLFIEHLEGLIDKEKIQITLAQLSALKNHFKAGSDVERRINIRLRRTTRNLDQNWEKTVVAPMPPVVQTGKQKK